MKIEIWMAKYLQNPRIFFFILPQWNTLDLETKLYKEIHSRYVMVFSGNTVNILRDNKGT